MYKTDVFHTLKVGFLRDFCGSAICCLSNLGYFGDGNFPSCLQVAHCSFKGWCRQTGHTPALRKFTKLFFNYKNANSYPWVNSKGSDTMLLVGWLNAVAADFKSSLLDDDHQEFMDLLLQTTAATVKFFKLLYAHPCTVSRKCAMQTYTFGTQIINGYVLLAAKTPNIGLCGFGIKPKIHLFKHMLYSYKVLLLSGCERFVNLLLFNCEQNEDLIGRMSRLSRRLDSRQVSRRCLECYLLKAGMLWTRFKRTHGI